MYVPQLKHDTFCANIKQIIILQKGGKIVHKLNNIDVQSGPISLSAQSKCKACPAVVLFSKLLKIARVLTPDRDPMLTSWNWGWLKEK